MSETKIYLGWLESEVEKEFHWPLTPPVTPESMIRSLLGALSDGAEAIRHLVETVREGKEDIEFILPLLQKFAERELIEIGLLARYLSKMKGTG